jgi:hypothetical protein
MGFLTPDPIVPVDPQAEAIGLQRDKAKLKKRNKELEQSKADAERAAQKAQETAAQWESYARRLEQQLEAQRQETKKLGDSLEIARETDARTAKKLSDDLAEVYQKFDPASPLSNPDEAWTRTRLIHNDFMAREIYRKGRELPDDPRIKDAMRSWPFCTRCGSKVPPDVSQCRECRAERKPTTTTTSAPTD